MEDRLNDEAICDGFERVVRLLHLVQTWVNDIWHL